MTLIKKKIAISALHIRPGKCGSHEPYLVNLLRGLSKVDKVNQYTIFVNSINKYLFFDLNDNYLLYECSSLTRFVVIRIIYEQLILPIMIYFRKKFDVVHFPGNIIPFIHPFPTIVTIHTDSFRARSSMKRLQRIYYDIFMRNNYYATKIIVPSNVYKNQLIELCSFQSTKITPIHHGFDTNFSEKSFEEKKEFQLQWKIEKDSLLSVTNTQPHKNLINLFSALEYLDLNFGINLQLVLVGYINIKLLNNYLNVAVQNPKNLIKRIKIIQFTNNSELPEIYNSSSIFILPSKEESFGMPIIEAMACNMPIVISNIPVFKEIAADAALYFDPDNPQDIAIKIKDVVINNNQRKTLCENGKRIIKNYSWEKTALQTLETYLSVDTK